MGKNYNWLHNTNYIEAKAKKNIKKRHTENFWNIYEAGVYISNVKKKKLLPKKHRYELRVCKKGNANRLKDLLKAFYKRCSH